MIRRGNLKTLHWLHALLILGMLGTGVVLYFPILRTFWVAEVQFIRSVHIYIGLGYALFLFIYLPVIFRYGRLPHRKWAKRINLTLFIMANAIWLATGIILWVKSWFPLGWQPTALFWHGRFSELILFWIIFHTVLRWLRIRFPSWKSSETTNSQEKERDSVQTPSEYKMSRGQFIGAGTSFLFAFIIGGFLRS